MWMFSSSDPAEIQGRAWFDSEMLSGTNAFNSTVVDNYNSHKRRWRFFMLYFCSGGTSDRNAEQIKQKIDQLPRALVGLLYCAAVCE